MEKYFIKDIKNATMGRLQGLQGKESVSGLSINSMQVKKGDLFIALKGNRVDGHDFVDQAIAKGAVAALVEEPVAGRPCIVVRDTRKALGKLATAYRNRFGNVKVIAVTGSSGKTTVKEMITHILKSKANVMMSYGNFNNDLGLPLSLADLTSRHRFAVMEMGMNASGEIKKLCQIAKPEIGVITNIGEAHIGNFKNQRVLANAKLELLRALPASGLAILNQDDFYLKIWRDKIAGLGFGLSDDADIKVIKTGVRISGTHIVLGYKKQFSEIRLKTLGTHHAWNAAAAVATAMSCGFSFKTASQGLTGFKPVAGMRTEIKKVGSCYLINDAYNSNPQSAAAAVNLLTELNIKGKKTMIVGDMLELGSFSKEAHSMLGQWIAASDIDYLLATGNHSKWTVAAAKKAGKKDSFYYKSFDELKHMLEVIVKKSGLVLLKGSRGIGLEQLIPAIRKAAV